jgi:hypothetical protein
MLTPCLHKALAPHLAVGVVLFLHHIVGASGS